MLLRLSIATLSLAFLILPAQARHLKNHHHAHPIIHPIQHNPDAPSQLCHGTVYDNDGRIHCSGGNPGFAPSPLEGRGGAGPGAYVRHHGSGNNESPGGAGPRVGLDLVTVATAANPIRVARSAADRFKAVVADLVAHGFHGHVECYAAHGHIPHSLHHTGEACDFAQISRNVVAKGASVMYHASDIIATHGLRDGCSFHDCGHVDTGRATYARARRARRIHLALRR